MRQNDISEQMRTIARQLTPEEMRAVAVFYGVGLRRCRQRGDDDSHRYEAKMIANDFPGMASPPPFPISSAIKNQ